MTAPKKIPSSWTLADFQNTLTDQINKIVNGETTAANANAVVNLTAAYLRTIKMQMDYAKQTGRTPNIPLLQTVPAEEAAA